MKKALTIAIAAISIGFSSLTLADRDRGRYDGYNRHYDNHGYREHRSYRHGKRHYRHHRYHDYRPQVRYYAPVRHETVIYHDDDDVYKFMGGMYLLNEVLHHDRH